MSQPVVRRSKNLQFSHAAAAMGAFWAGARKNETHRIEKLRRSSGVLGCRRLVAPILTRVVVPQRVWRPPGRAYQSRSPL